MELTPEEWVAVRLSLRVAFVATLVSLPLGIAAAYALARGRFPGRVLLDGLVHMPLVLPPVVTGYLLLLGFGRRGRRAQRQSDECAGQVCVHQRRAAAVQPVQRHDPAAARRELRRFAA